MFDDMVDIHSHALWGMDDGARYFEESMDLCFMAEESGTKTLFLTPHLIYWNQAETLYDLRYCSMDHLLESEYVVLEPSRTADFRNYVKGEEDGYENLQQILASNGYVIKEAADEIVVYHKDQ